VSTFNGIPMAYDLVPDNTDERKATEAVIDYFSFCDSFADKGLLGFKWQTQIFNQTNNLIWTPRRANQHYQNAKNLDRWLNSIRERIEGVFHEVQNTGRNIKRLLTKTVLGLCTRVIMKMTSHLLRICCVSISMLMFKPSRPFLHVRYISHQMYFNFGR
jgi:hypothetical protein